MVYGMIHCRSSKYKLNTKITTESDIVGTSEYVTFNIWLVMFYQAQGYEITTNVLFQDNESAINMDNNEQQSCTGNSRHFNILHFYVNNIVDIENIEVQFCLTHLMIADYFTNPFKG